MYAWHRISCLLALVLIPFTTTPSRASSALMSLISIESTSGIFEELVHSPEVSTERSPRLWQTPTGGKECFIPATATPSVHCATTIAPSGCFHPQRFPSVHHWGQPSSSYFVWGSSTFRSWICVHWVIHSKILWGALLLIILLGALALLSGRHCLPK